MLSLYRRQGYEFAPVGFGLCPALQEKYKAVAGDTPIPEFDYPEGFATAGVFLRTLCVRVGPVLR